MFVIPKLKNLSKKVQKSPENRLLPKVTVTKESCFGAPCVIDKGKSRSKIGVSWIACGSSSSGDSGNKSKTPYELNVSENRNAVPLISGNGAARNKEFPL